MLNKFFESDFTKKILLSLFISAIYIFVLIIFSLSNSNKFVYVVLNIIFIMLLAIVMKKIEIKNWLNNNMNYVKKNLIIGLVIISIMVIISTFLIDYRKSMENIVNFSLIFLLFIFSFIIISNNKKDINLSIKLLKTFSSVFVLMSIMVYFTMKDAITLQNESYKIQIENSSGEEKKELLEKYKNSINSITNFFLFKEVEFAEMLKNDNIEIKKDKKEYQFFINTASSIILITIIICLIQLINNSSYFSNIKNQEVRE